MAKGVNKRHDVIKIFGIKIYDFISDYSWKEYNGDTDEIINDIILHERISENLYKKDNDTYL